MACTLIPINLSDPSEAAELQQQRTVCGWDNTPEHIAIWREKQEAGLKSFFWITTSTKPAGHSPSESEIPVRAGHISLDAYAEPADWELANADKTRVTVQTFFILPEHRSSGFGGSAMRQIAALAAQEPFGSAQCEYVTLNCLSKKHYYDEVLGPIARKIMPICNQEWYERQGYVAWKVEPRYKEVLMDGRTLVFNAAFMRKRVNRS